MYMFLGQKQLLKNNYRSKIETKCLTKTKKKDGKKYILEESKINKRKMVVI